MQKIPSGTLSETRNNSQYVLTVKLGLDVENVPIDARLKNPEVLARQEFTRMIDRRVANK